MSLADIIFLVTAANATHPRHNNVEFISTSNKAKSVKYAIHNNIYYQSLLTDNATLILSLLLLSLHYTSEKRPTSHLTVVLTKTAMIQPNTMSLIRQYFSTEGYSRHLISRESACRKQDHA